MTEHKKVNRSLRKLASGSRVQGARGTEDRSVLNIHEDLSTEATSQPAAEVEFPKRSNVYLASDASGTTVLNVADAVLAQFHNLQAKKFMWPMIRSHAQVDHLMSVMREKPGILLYTMVDEDMENYLLESCGKHGLTAISVLGHVLDGIRDLFKLENSLKKPGLQHRVYDEHYVNKITAIDYTLAHDDGQNPDNIYTADILLLGVSRTSKSPTSLYLAQRGYKTANIPIIKGIKAPIDFSKFQSTLIVGLTVSPEKLKSIRDNRLNSLLKPGTKSDTGIDNYTDISFIREEVIEARRFFDEHSIPVIDVTNKAIEETSGEIINMYNSEVRR
ncbi:MAG: phosphoenolpyruvate synthase regulatory protein [Candidatus Midichloriaceae bacterium]|nr:phosphoenolpyruvate synthase regulatory protein [Candidatus Midichloriaceae bacterium]